MIAYPVVVWLGLSSGSPRLVATALLAVMAPALLLRRRAAAREGLAVVPVAIFLLLGAAALLNESGLVLATPVAANVVLLATFGVTLRRGSAPMIERFARLQEPSLDAPKRAWCRLWTKLWCAFFVANGATAAALALRGDLQAWALYNGMIAYALIAAMLGLEWALRRARFGPTQGSDSTDEPA